MTGAKANGFAPFSIKRHARINCVIKKGGYQVVVKKDDLINS